MKSKQPLWRISVATSAEAEDAVSELVSRVTGVAAVAYFHCDSQISQVSAFLEEGNWNRSAARKEITSGLAHIRSCGLATGPAGIEIARVRREDWAESWKRHFKPMVIRGGGDESRGKSRAACSLLVKPSWSRKKPAKNQAVVILDPGLSFGTGQHPTTSFCLRELVRSREAGEPGSFLDLGTGSGILAIAAVKLGYAPVAALDFDPEAVRVARDNARRNGVADQLRPVRGDVTKLPLRPARQYNLVCANLISTLLIAERRRIARQVKPGGRLVLAGILAAEFAEVRRAYADMQIKLCSSQTQNEWCSGAFCVA
jgi:ribosomal protein L11 methyltransferase